MRRGIVAIAVVVAVLCGAELSGAARNAAGGAKPRITGWLSFGNGAARPGSTATALDPRTLRPNWFRATDGMVTTQPLVARNVPAAGQQTAYVATNAGRVIAYAPNGYVRWQRTLGALPNSCSQLADWGVVGTPVIDPGSRALYVADGFGLLHALDLVTGQDRPGWPVRIYDDPSAELVWGALAFVGGSVYVGTGSYCDRSMVGKLIRVEVATRRMSTWAVVPSELGGGGSIWGWAARPTAPSGTRSSSSPGTHSKEARTPVRHSTRLPATANSLSRSRPTCTCWQRAIRPTCRAPATSTSLDRP